MTINGRVAALENAVTAGADVLETDSSQGRLSEIGERKSDTPPSDLANLSEAERAAWTLVKGDLPGVSAVIQSYLENNNPRQSQNLLNDSTEKRV